MVHISFISIYLEDIYEEKDMLESVLFQLCSIIWDGLRYCIINYCLSVKTFFCTNVSVKMSDPNH